MASLKNVFVLVISVIVINYYFTSLNWFPPVENTFVVPLKSYKEQTESKKPPATATEESVSPIQSVESVKVQSSYCDKPPRDSDLEELLSRYRLCMRSLVSRVQDNVKLQNLEDKTQLDQQNQPEDFGMLNGDPWRRVASRLSLLKRGCNKHAQEITSTPEFDGIIFDQTHHLAYFKHPKAGSSFLLGFLYALNGVGPGQLTHAKIHRLKFNFFSKPTVKDTRQNLIREYFSFTAVRHPFKRLVSAYCNKIFQRIQLLRMEIRHTNAKKRREELKVFHYKEVEAGTGSLPSLSMGPWIRRAVPYNSRPNSLPDDGSILAHYLTAKTLKPNPTTPKKLRFDTFRQFIHGVLVELLQCGANSACQWRVDPHFRPQVVAWNPCILDFDMVMKVETLNEDISMMMDLVGREDQVEEEDQRKRIKDTPKERIKDTPKERIKDTHKEIDENLKPEDNFKKATTKRALNQSHDEGVGKNGGEGIRSSKNAYRSLSIEDKGRENSFAGNNNIVQISGSKVRKNRSVEALEAQNSSQEAGQVESDQGPEPEVDFVELTKNKSDEKCATYEEYMKQLSQRDIDLLYTAYYLDFELFGYEPFD